MMRKDHLFLLIVFCGVFVGCGYRPWVGGKGAVSSVEIAEVKNRTAWPGVSRDLHSMISQSLKSHGVHVAGKKTASVWRLSVEVHRIAGRVGQMTARRNEPTPLNTVYSIEGIFSLEDSTGHSVIFREPVRVEAQAPVTAGIDEEERSVERTLAKMLERFMEQVVLRVLEI